MPHPTTRPTTGNHDDAILEFQRKLREDWTLKAACGRLYVLVEQLKAWMRSKESADSDTTQAGRLLRAAYNTNDILPISTEQISTGEDCCLLVFSILLELGCADLVHLFQRWDIVDRNLPANLSSLRTNLLRQSIHNAETIATRFEEERWRFCPKLFELDIARDVPAKCVIPICKREQINHKGGTAKVCQIMVQEEFVGPRLRKAASTSRFEHWEFGCCYQFALKTFDASNVDTYRTEQKAFHGLRDHDGMVRYLGDYSYEDRSTQTVSAQAEGDVLETTYNILLEYGDLDLDEFFAERLPPVLSSEIVDFWKDLFEVPEAVQRMHNLETRTGGQVQEYHGWHADIKPDNILSVQGKFKLADFGFAKFKPKTDKAPMEFINGGTDTYGAPECDPGRRGTLTPVSQTIDTWSLGCVFSLAATWVVIGYQGIRQFISVRTKAIEKIRQDQQSRGQGTVLTTGDRFHDGRDVLPVVRDWHNVLRNAMRKTDTITSGVLDLVDEEMLLGDPSKRIPSKQLCVKLKQILRQALAERQESIPKTIVEALLEVDQDALPNAVESAITRVEELAYQKAKEPAHDQAATQTVVSLTVPETRQARKSRRLNIPLMKTTNRSENLKSVLAAHIEAAEGPSVLCESPAEEDPTGMPVMPHNTELTPSSRHQPNTSIQSSDLAVERHDVVSPQTSYPPATPSPNRSLQPVTSNEIPIQTVEQARKEIDSQKKRFWKNWKKTRKDKLLEQYFKNRDIKFLVDNGSTMASYWQEATYLLETLVMKAEGLDKDGMDLIFTGGERKLKDVKDSSKFRKTMEREFPNERMRTDMKTTLGTIFDEHLKRIHRREDVKNTTLYVLTDGMWEGMVRKDGVEDKIVDFVKQLIKSMGSMKERPFSIEFIRFGNDADAISRLQHLDDKLKQRDIPDVIDAEPSSGDVYKMLLGSFNEKYDEIVSEPVTPGNPTQPAEARDIFQGTGVQPIGAEGLGIQETSSATSNRPSNFGAFLPSIQTPSSSIQTVGLSSTIQPHQSGSTSPSGQPRTEYS